VVVKRYYHFIAMVTTVFVERGSNQDPSCLIDLLKGFVSSNALLAPAENLSDLLLTLPLPA